MEVENKDMPAFPANSRSQDCGGLTKREYFAGIAMQGLLANGYAKEGSQFNEEWIAAKAVNLSDALLKQLQK